MPKTRFDVIVIGGGHAGCEAALAAFRMGARVAMITLRKERIAHMPCNPAVGGLAKGHLVKELDALGGEMGRVTDLTGIQFRMLNRSKGPAVWSPRAQVDKVDYARLMRRTIETQEDLSIVEGEVLRPIVRRGRFVGVELRDGGRVLGEACVLTTGTFLRGLMHTGERKRRGGREGEPEASTLSDALRAHGFRVGRLKTGTPPRVLKCSVDLTCFEPQPGDEDPTPFSHKTEAIATAQEMCYLTHTTDRTHEIIRKNLHRAPMYRGDIEGIGARYCPSIEDKVVRFPDKVRHQIFIEPEGRAHPELYLNGISTSLPVDVQLEVLASIPGLDTAVMRRPGYAVEYDFFPPEQLKRSFESKIIEGLFFAGQVNGTSGYEEAAAQGFMAGVNAVRRLRQLEPLVLGRDEAYVGVLVDDLTTKEIDEPYRMFTSRAEFRLLLRQDNADARLMSYGVALGLVDPRHLERVERRMARVGELVAGLGRTVFPAASANPCFEAAGLAPVKKSCTLLQVLRRPDVRFHHIEPFVGESPEGLGTDVECAVKYSGYLERQWRDVKTVREMEAQPIPAGFDYSKILGLSTEARQKLMTKRPETVSHASRIAGVRASDLSILVIHLERQRRARGGPRRAYGVG